MDDSRISYGATVSMGLISLKKADNLCHNTDKDRFEEYFKED